jgi:hypothetical protein
MAKSAYPFSRIKYYQSRISHRSHIAVKKLIFDESQAENCLKSNFQKYKI